MPTNLIRYTFELGPEESLGFEIDIARHDSETRTPFQSPQIDYPEWAQLEHHQCSCCPLKPETDPYCPTAVRIHELMETFKSSTSVEKVKVTVETSRRTYSNTCDLQSGLNSMLGLKMATSGCPVVSQFRSMATFHVPFSTFSETLYRSTTAYLMKQYFAHIEGHLADWDLVGLCNAYKDLEILNQAFSERISQIEQSDAVTNAIVIFFASSIVAASSIEEHLAEFKDYFTGNTATPPDGA